MRILMITTSHRWNDTRIFHLESTGLVGLGVSVSILAVRETSLPSESAGIRLIANSGSVRRLGRFIRNPCKAFLYCFRHREEFDIFHFHDPEFLPLGALLAILIKKPVIYDMHEFLPDIMLHRPWVPSVLRRILSAIANVMEGLCIRIVGNVVAMNEIGEARAIKLGAKRATAFLGVPSKEFPVHSVACGTPRSGVVYVGGVGLERGADLIVRVAPQLYELCGTVTYVAGPLQDASACKVRNTPGVCYLGELDRAHIIQLLRSCEVGWVPLHRTPNYEKTWLLKIGEYMAAGLPVVINDLGYTGAVVRRYGCGIVVNDDHPDAHRDALVTLITDKNVAQGMGERGRQAIMNELNNEVFSSRLRDFYTHLLCV